MKELQVEAIRVSLMNYQRLVVLKEKETDRYLPIWIGAAEADAIAVRLQEHPVARPMTHDLVTTMLQDLGARVGRVVVTDLDNDTFFARIYLDVDGREVEIDARPSDAIALAVRSEAPIFAEDAVIEQAGMVLDAEGEPEGAQDGKRAPPPVKAEELERMSAFRDFIESLDLDDFDKR